MWYYFDLMYDYAQERIVEWEELQAYLVSFDTGE